MTIKNSRHVASQDDDALELTENVAAFARRKWPQKAAENLSAVLKVCVRTGERIMEARRPLHTKHLARLTVVFGMEFVATVFHPLAAREAHAEHIAVREYLARQRASNEEKRILEGEAAALSGQGRKSASLAVRTAGATVRLIAKLSGRRKAVAQ